MRATNSRDYPQQTCDSSCTAARCSPTGSAQRTTDVQARQCASWSKTALSTVFADAAPQRIVDMPARDFSTVALEHAVREHHTSTDF